MRFYLPGAIALSLLLTGGLTPSVHAENLMHTQQLLTTKDCAGCDLTKAGLVYANLLGANLANANLVQANLSHSDLSGANLSQAQLNGTVLFGANLSNADLSGANLAGADLRETILTNANLEGANIQGANLMGAVGIPASIATVENFYRWGLEEAARGNFRGAIANYNQAINQDTDFAHAYLGRSIALFRLGDPNSALTDAQKAEQLYLAQNNERGQQVASQFAMGIEAAQKAYADQQEAQNGGGAGGNILNVIGGLAGMALQVLQYMAF